MIKKLIGTTIALASILLSGCNGISSDKGGFKVSIISGEHFKIIGQKSKYFSKGEEIFFELEVEEGYRLYLDKKFEYRDGKYYFPEINFPTTINTFAEDKQYVFYGYSEEKSCRDGGSIVNRNPFYSGMNLVPNYASPGDVILTYQISEKRETDVYYSTDIVNYCTFYGNNSYLAPISLRGEEVSVEEGKTLIEYKTKNGKVYNLGSIMDIFTAGNYNVSCVFENWDPVSNFEYQILGNEATLLSCKVNKEKVVIPSKIEGKTVTKIATNAFNDLDNLNTLIMPDHVKEIEDEAINNCDNLKTVYMNDNVRSITSSAFKDSPFKTLCMNAYGKPSSSGWWKSMRVKLQAIQFAKHVGKRVVVYHGGSSALYAYEFSPININYQNTYFINAGHTAAISPSIMLSYISTFLDGEDILIHTPEYGIAQYTKTVTRETWMALEESMQAFRYIDATKFDMFSEYNSFITLKDEPTKEPDGYFGYVDKYNGQLLEINDEKTYVSGPHENFTVTTFEAFDMGFIDTIYSEIAAKGIVMINQKCPFDIASIASQDDLVVLNNYIKSQLSIPVLGDFEDYLLDTDLFYNSDYHLQSHARLGFTNMSLGDLMEYLNSQGIYLC